MTANPKDKGRATRPCQFRLSEADVATIDRIAREIAGDAAVTVSRTDVIRVGIALAKAKYLK